MSASATQGGHEESLDVDGDTRPSVPELTTPKYKFNISLVRRLST